MADPPPHTRSRHFDASEKSLFSPLARRVAKRFERILMAHPHQASVRKHVKDVADVASNLDNLLHIGEHAHISLLPDLTNFSCYRPLGIKYNYKLHIISFPQLTCARRPP